MRNFSQKLHTPIQVLQTVGLCICAWAVLREIAYFLCLIGVLSRHG